MSINLNVILVGSCPLPCYIQAAYVMQEYGEIEKPDYTLFVATKATSNYVKNIKSVLSDKQLFNTNKMQIDLVLDDTISLGDGYNSYEIEKEILDYLEKINRKKRIGEILLNNTGGTKAMAVYATSAVRKFAKGKGVIVTECFVDPIENRIRCYELGNIGSVLYPKNGTGKTLKDYIRLDIEDLIRLHYGKGVRITYSDVNGIASSDGIAYNPMNDKQRNIAISILTDNNVYSNYDRFYTKYCRNVKDGDRKEKTEAIVQKMIPREVNVLHTIFNPNGEVTNFQNETEIENIAPFIDGQWLEKYFYTALLEAKNILEEEESVSIQTVWSCKVMPEEQYGKEFEVDILAVKGYELTLFSVSMADYAALAKSKWFEAVYRTEQMAGEHGKVAVVNLLLEDQDDNLMKFKTDLKTFKRDVETFNQETMKNFDYLVECIVEKFAD